MKSRNIVIGLCAVAGLAAAGNTGYAETVQTPFSPNEAGPAILPAEEAAMHSGDSRYIGTSMGPAQGGTVGDTASGTLSSGGARLNLLPETTFDSRWEPNKIGD
ncbi:MAG: hypothetical protein ACM3SS_17775 [Rhodospirillaceae bacterium]